MDTDVLWLAQFAAAVAVTLLNAGKIGGAVLSWWRQRR